MSRTPYPTVPYRPERISTEDARQRMRAEVEVADGRRSVRHFSSDPVPREVIEDAIRVAGTAPSGAHRQPWYFVAISDPELKQQIRDAAEHEEREFYERRATPAWLDAIEPLGTDFVKEHITDAPWIIIVFRRDYEVLPSGERLKAYYPNESVGIAVGFLIYALHRAGLATLTHTPNPMTFLRHLCGRPANEKPFVIMPVGYPSDDCVVPDITRKPLDAISDIR